MPKHRKNLILKKWTPLSVECFRRQMQCEGCDLIPKLESGECRLKYSVIELYQKFGRPFFGDSLFFGVEMNADETKLLKEIRSGKTTYKDLAEAGAKVRLIKEQIMPTAEAKGMIIKNRKIFLKELYELMLSDEKIFWSLK